MRAALALVLLVACGSKQPAPRPAIAEKPLPAAAADCTDAGVILRGELELDDAEAGRARERAIDEACRADAWPQAVIDCVASTPRAQDCLAKLDERQRAGYDQRLEAWSQVHEASGGTGMAMRTSFVDCHDLTRDVSQYPPVLEDGAPERDWQLAGRREVITEECDHEWPDDLKACLQDAGAVTKDLESCFGVHLPDASRTHLDQELAELGELAAKIAAAKQKPANITCKKVVVTHYGETAWKHKLDGYKPAERKKMITASRDAMTKACSAESWDDTMRACIVAGGGEACFAAASRRKWGYPATGTVTVVGISECDEYNAEVTKLVGCAQLPQTTRDSLVRSQQQVLAEIARAPSSQRAAMATSCTAAVGAIREMLVTSGC